MKSRVIRFFRFGVASVFLLVSGARGLRAQVMVYPDAFSAFASLPEPREPAPEDPMMEPVVSLASMVAALGDALGSGRLSLSPKTGLALELQLSALIDSPVLSRVEAGRHAADLSALLEPRQLVALVGIAQRQGYGVQPFLLGADSATANPFYDPGSLPGYAARFVLAHLQRTLRPAGE